MVHLLWEVCPISEYKAAVPCWYGSDGPYHHPVCCRAQCGYLGFILPDRCVPHGDHMPSRPHTSFSSSNPCFKFPHGPKQLSTVLSGKTWPWRLCQLWKVSGAVGPLLPRFHSPRPEQSPADTNFQLPSESWGDELRFIGRMENVCSVRKSKWARDRHEEIEETDIPSTLAFPWHVLQYVSIALCMWYIFFPVPAGKDPVYGIFIAGSVVS